MTRVWPVYWHYHKGCWEKPHHYSKQRENTYHLAHQENVVAFSASIQLFVFLILALLHLSFKLRCWELALFLIKDHYRTVHALDDAGLLIVLLRQQGLFSIVKNWVLVNVLTKLINSINVLLCELHYLENPLGSKDQAEISEVVESESCQDGKRTDPSLLISVVSEHVGWVNGNID